MAAAKSLETYPDPLSVITRSTVTPWASSQAAARRRKAAALDPFSGLLVALYRYGRVELLSRSNPARLRMRATVERGMASRVAMATPVMRSRRSSRISRCQSAGTCVDELRGQEDRSGDALVRRLLVNGAQYILSRGPDSDLKRWGLALAARGRKNAKKRAIVATARPATSAVGN